jgi:hypothetical protein
LKIEIENINSELEKINEMKLLEEKELNITKYEYFVIFREQLNYLYVSMKERNVGNVGRSDLEFVEEEVSIGRWGI